MQFKKLTTPWYNQTKEIENVQLWEVKWCSRHGQWHGDIEKETECFTNEKDAQDFATSLRNAFKLIRHTSGNQVSVTKRK